VLFRNTPRSNESRKRGDCPHYLQQQKPPAIEALRRLGYEPHLEGDKGVMANCPFHALAKTHTKLVCTMNHALLDGLCQRIGGLTASLQPGEGRCCVVLIRAG